MKIKVRLTADVALLRYGGNAQVDWPYDWPVPRVDDVLALPGITVPLAVKSVTFLPEGGDGGEPAEPYIAVAVGKYRP